MCMFLVHVVFLNISIGVLVKKIAIIGTGIGGLSTAASLMRINSGVVGINVYESRADYLQSTLGGGVQLTGGAKVIELLGCLEELKESSECLERVRSRTTSGNDILALDISQSIRLKSSESLCAKSNGEPLAYSIMRDALLKLLHQMISNGSSNEDRTVNIFANKECTEIYETDDDVILYFKDGTEERGFDIVIGADGIKSVARKYVEQNPLNFIRQENRYTGIRITYCVTKADPTYLLRQKSPDGRGSFNQYFGDGLYVLCASYGGLEGCPYHMVATVYKDSTDSVFGENIEWNKGGEKCTKSLLEALKVRLRRAGFTSKTPEIWTLLDACDDSRIFDLGVRDRTLPLGSWTSASGRIVLMGDAAHPMAPFLGQGANQALQDAYVLAQSIQTINRHNITSKKDSSKKIQTSMADYEKRRKLSTALLSAKSGILGVIETLGGPIGTFFRNNFFRIMGITGIAEYIFLDGAKPNL